MKNSSEKCPKVVLLVNNGGIPNVSSLQKYARVVEVRMRGSLDDLNDEDYSEYIAYLDELQTYMDVKSAVEMLENMNA